MFLPDLSSCWPFFYFAYAFYLITKIIRHNHYKRKKNVCFANGGLTFSWNGIYYKWKYSEGKNKNKNQGIDYVHLHQNQLYQIKWSNATHVIRFMYVCVCILLIYTSLPTHGKKESLLFLYVCLRKQNS